MKIEQSVARFQGETETVLPRGEREEASTVAAQVAALVAREEFGEARERAASISQDEETPELHIARAQAEIALGRAAEAIEGLQRAVAIFPASAVLRTDLGTALIQHAGDYSSARREFEELHRLDPHSLKPYLGLAECVIQDASFREALVRLSRVAEGEGAAEMMLAGLAAELLNHGRYEEARDCAQELVRRFPRHFMGHFALAKVTEEYEHDFVNAEQLLKGALRSNPVENSLVAAYLVLLGKTGQWARAHTVFAELFRRLEYSYPRFEFDCRNWDGGQVEGKTILLDSKLTTGFGDALHFVRFASWLKDRGATVGMIARKGIGTLLETVPGIDFVCRRFDPLPRLDCVAELAFLWLLLGAQTSNVGTQVPYLSVDIARAKEWRNRLGLDPHDLHVAIVWESSEPRVHNPYISRRAPLAALGPLAAMPKVKLYSLQKPSIPGILENMFSPATVMDLGNQLHDFMDTAAILSALDAVVTVDTSMVHLAGALNVPTFLLLAYSGEWRWLVKRNDSPWYPSVSICRQQSAGDWKSAVEQACDGVLRLAAAAGRIGESNGSAMSRR